MAHDYARKSRSGAQRKHYEPRVPAWVWMFTGSVLGAFIMFLLHLSKVEDATESELPFANVLSTEESPKPAVELPERPSSPFSFPKLLRDAEVKVSEEDAGSTTSGEALPSYEYMLQVASFKDIDDAEQVRAELILLNMDARIEKATIKEKETWHRVVVGPFTSRSKLSKARSTLISHNYNAQVRKRVIAS